MNETSQRPYIGIGVLVVNEQQQILLGKRINAHGAHTWAPPGGHLEFGESFESCAMREVWEETGLHIASPVVVAITNDVFVERQRHYVSIFFESSIYR